MKNFIFTHIIKCSMIFAVLFFSGNICFAAEASFVPKEGRVYLKDGGVVKGNIIVSGPKGVVIIVENSENLENFIPLGKIKKIERYIPDRKVSSDDTLKTFYVKTEDGKLVLTADKVVEEDDGDRDKPESSEKSEKKSPRRKKKKRAPLPSLLDPKRTLSGDKKEDKKEDNREPIFVIDDDDDEKGQEDNNNGHKDFDDLLD